MSEQKRIAFGYNRNESNRIIINETTSFDRESSFLNFMPKEKALRKFRNNWHHVRFHLHTIIPNGEKQALSKILSYERYLGLMIIRELLTGNC
jgi:hypothetical protein